MKIINFFLILLIVSLQSCKGQNDKKHTNIIKTSVVSLSEIVCGKNTSSQKDYKNIKNWKLTANDVLQIMKKSEEIDAQDLHYIYNNLPCEIEGKIKHKGKIKHIIFNAGGYYYFDNKIYGCKSKECLKYYPDEAKEDIIDESTTDKVVENNNNDTEKWQGNYSLSIDYGKLDDFSEISIDYNIEIKGNNCTFSGMGYKTYFTDECDIEEKNNILILKYKKNIDGDGFSDHSKMDYLGTIIYKNNEYYLKSPIVADSNWNYNEEIKLFKAKNK